MLSDICNYWPGNSQRKFGFAESIKECDRSYHLCQKKRKFLITTRPGESGFAGLVNSKLISINVF